MKSQSPDQVRRLRAELARIFRGREEIEIIVEEAELPLERVNTAGASEEVWHRVLQEAARRHNGIEDIVRIAHKRAPASAVLSELVGTTPHLSSSSVQSPSTDPGSSLTSTSMPPGTRQGVFISYSRADRAYVDQLRNQLKPREKMGRLSLWDDSQIRAGQLWKEVITEQLQKARYGVLIVSPDFLASDFIAKHELPPILIAAASKELTLFCIYVRPSLVDFASFDVTDQAGKAHRLTLTEFQGLNAPSAPLSSLSPARRQDALTGIAARLVQEVGDGSK